MAVILNGLARHDGTMSEWNATIPDYVMIKKKKQMSRADVKRLFGRMKKHFAKQGRFDEIDGLRIDLGRSWIHVRPSGTEPAVRLFAEAPTKKEAESLIQIVSSLF